ncbi:uncharacterized protein [Prorops nasuta]|uniref:uncharacterized protein n=1 Tax=Prorops nasuta TaxID=863751 RepID=UPI0034CF8F53
MSAKLQLRREIIPLPNCAVDNEEESPACSINEMARYADPSESLERNESFNIQSRTPFHNCNCCEMCTKEYKKEMKQLSRQMYALEALLKEHLSQCGGSTVCAQGFATDRLPSFPIRTITDLEKVDGDMQKDSVMKEQFEQRLIRIGGPNYKLFTRNILHDIISNELGCCLSWTGQRHRFCFKTTSLAKIIVEIVMKQHSQCSSAVEAVMQEWIRRSGDRMRSSARKTVNRSQIAALLENQ